MHISERVSLAQSCGHPVVRLRQWCVQQALTLQLRDADDVTDAAQVFEEYILNGKSTVEVAATEKA